MQIRLPIILAGGNRHEKNGSGKKHRAEIEFVLRAWIIVAVDLIFHSAIEVLSSRCEPFHLFVSMYDIFDAEFSIVIIEKYTSSSNYKYIAYICKNLDQLPCFLILF